MDKVLNSFEQFYLNFNLENKDLFSQVYDDNVTFKDPFHQIEGADHLYQYFISLMKNVKECHFVIKHIGSSDHKNAFIVWDMTLLHPFLNKGKPFIVSGTTHLIIEDKVIFHRDYFDGADLIYKRLPLLSPVINFIQRKVS